MKPEKRKQIEEDVTEHFAAVAEHILGSFSHPRDFVGMEIFQSWNEDDEDLNFYLSWTVSTDTGRRRGDGLTPFIDNESLSLHTKTPEKFHFEVSDRKYWNDPRRSIYADSPIAISVNGRPNKARREELHRRFGPLVGLDQALAAQGESFSLVTNWSLGNPLESYSSISHITRAATARIRDEIPDIPKDISDSFDAWSAARLSKGAKKGLWTASLSYLWRAVHVLEILSDEEARNPDLLFSRDTLDKVRDLHSHNPATSVRVRSMENYLKWAWRFAYEADLAPFDAELEREEHWRQLSAAARQDGYTLSKLTSLSSLKTAFPDRSPQSFTAADAREITDRDAKSGAYLLDRLRAAKGHAAKLLPKEPIGPLPDARHSSDEPVWPAKLQKALEVHAAQANSDSEIYTARSAVRKALVNLDDILAPEEKGEDSVLLLSNPDIQDRLLTHYTTKAAQPVSKASAQVSLRLTRRVLKHVSSA
jgi:hypothetical protein